jgi:hypothetical protein
MQEPVFANAPSNMLEREIDHWVMLNVMGCYYFATGELRAVIERNAPAPSRTPTHRANCSAAPVPCSPRGARGLALCLHDPLADTLA